MLKVFLKRALILLPLCISACTTLTPTEQAPKVAKRPASALQCFAISGGLAAKSKAKSFTASMNWQQKGNATYKIRLFGPLGGGAVMIEREGGMVVLKDSNKESRAKDAESLLAQQTGVRLPVQNLYYWVRGIKAPGAAKETFDAEHRLSALTQNGFVITYEDYNEVEGFVLPSHIKLVGNTVFAKLVIKRWYICS